MDEMQRRSLQNLWASSPYSYQDLFDGTLAVPVDRLLAHLEAHGLTRTGAVGWLATMTQVGRLQMISSDLVGLGVRSQTLPAWIAAPEEG